MRLTTRCCTFWASSALLIGASSLSGGSLTVTGGVPDQFNQLWHTRGRDGLTCASCHTESGREIWMGGFGKDDVVRRARRHLSESDALALGEAVVALRGSMSPASKFPFAPGGAPLPAQTPAEGEAAFLKGLRRTRFPLLTQTVRTREEALRIAKDVLAQPLTDIPVGIRLDPVSRDPVHADSAPFLNDWIPDVPKERRRATSFSELSDLKAKALDIYVRSLSNGEVALPELRPGDPDHPIWAVGNFARILGENPTVDLGASEDELTVAGLRPKDPLAFDQMALSWFWIGWTLDPTLRHMAQDRQARNGSYMAALLWETGPYPLHAAFFAARRPLEIRRSRPDLALQPDWTHFVNSGALERYEPRNSEARHAFRQICRNLLRLSCWLVVDDLEKGRKIANPVGAIQQVDALWSYVATIESASSRTADEDLVKRTRAALIPRAKLLTDPKP